MLTLYIGFEDTFLKHFFKGLTDSNNQLHIYYFLKDINKYYNNMWLVSRPGQNKGLLYKPGCDSLIKLLTHSVII